MPARRPLNDSEVADLFNPNKAAWVTKVDQCDQCSSRKDPCLEFGGDSGLEMPVIPGSELHDVLETLRERLGRRSIILCYRCTDDLEEPLNGPRFHRFERTPSPVTMTDDLAPRLFEV